MFIIELTHRSYYHTIENKRKTLQRSDIAQTIASTDIYDFLQDIIPKEELREAQANNKKANEEVNLRPAGGMGEIQNPQTHQDILAGADVPRMQLEESKDDKEMRAEILADDKSKKTSLKLFTETDPANLNQLDKDNDEE